jgi:hypothetical protein
MVGVGIRHHRQTRAWLKALWLPVPHQPKRRLGREKERAREESRLWLVYANILSVCIRGPPAEVTDSFFRNPLLSQVICPTYSKLWVLYWSAENPDCARVSRNDVKKFLTRDSLTNCVHKERPCNPPAHALRDIMTEMVPDSAMHHVTQPEYAWT